MLFNIPISKLDGRFESFDWDELPEQSRYYSAQYGLKKSINDANASVKRADYDDGPDGQAEWELAVEAASMERVEQIRSGNVPGTRAPVKPQTQLVNAVVRELEKRGVDAKSIDPAKLIQAIADQLAA